MASLKANTSGQNLTFVMVNATTGAGSSAASVSGYVTKDGGSQSAAGGTVTSLGNGQFNYAPTQAETNATDVGFLFTASGYIPCNLDFHTDIVSSAGYVRTDIASVNAIGSSLVTAVNAILGTSLALSFDSGGYPWADVVSVNGVSASAVTTVKAVLGTSVAVPFDSGGLLNADVQSVAASSVAAANVSKTNQAIGRGQVGSGATTTSVTTQSFSFGVGSAGQFIGRTIIFDAGTATTALQGQATSISSNSSAATPTFTVVALTTAPSSADTFSIV